MKLLQRFLGHSVLAAILVLTLSVSAVAEPPKPAKEILAAAQTEAQRGGKTVWVLFHASWCGWCHKMEGVMKLESVKPIIEKYFVVRWLTVLESPAHKADENPGGQELMETNDGKNQGIPFFFFTDTKGKVLGNSKIIAGKDGKMSNVGCPATPEEIASFLELMKKVAPKITDAELAKLKAGFETIKN